MHRTQDTCHKERGAMSLPAVLIISTILLELIVSALILAAGLSNTALNRKLAGEALQAARAGADDAFLYVKRNCSSEVCADRTYTVPVGNSTATIAIARDIVDQTIVITSQAQAKTTKKKVTMVVAIDENTEQVALKSVQESAIIVLNSNKELTSFFIPNQTDSIINESAKTVAISVPYGTNVTALVPTITHTGESVSPASGVAHNFTTPQTYTVVAEDATSQNYTVTVSINPPIWACGDTLTDTRDSQTYSTRTYGTACWMTQNLNYGTYIAVVSSQSLGQKFCQNYSGVNDPTCPIGGLYQWATAMNGSASCNGTGAAQPACSSPVQGICPTGWHIPSHYEWTYLEKQAGSNPGAFPYNTSTTGFLGDDEGKYLKEAGTTHWASGNTGTNTRVFTALPGGYSHMGLFYNTQYIARWWSSTQRNSTTAWDRSLFHWASSSYREYNNKVDYSSSIRCVKD